MLKTISVPLVLPLLLLFGNGSDKSAARLKQINNGSDNSVARVKQNSPESPESQTGTLEKMMVADGSATMDIDLNRLNGVSAKSQMNSLRFTLAPNSFFTILVLNKVLRGPEPGSVALIAQSSATLPAALNATFNQLVIEKISWSEPFDIVVRDGKTGFTFFNIEGNLYDYDAKAQLLSIKEGRLLISEEFAAKLGRSTEAGSVVGKISITATMRTIEITHVVNGKATSALLPPLGALVPGPDVIVGDLPSLQQFGSSGTQVGLAVATDSCNAGAEPLNWFALPNNDHPVIPQNLYRMSGGATNDERFEQIGQSWLKHAFTALQQDLCGFGCQSSGTGTLLGAGCSDPYSASLNSGGTGNNLGSRAWVNPFTGFFPRGDSATPPRNHSGHTHNGTSHRILVETTDLNTTLNPGATYYVEAQYVTPHEYAWCQANPGQCNMYNNVSYRRFNVTGTSSFTFAPVGTTVQTKSAIVAWTGATHSLLEPAPGVDGVAYVSFKVTNPSPGVWHYEYLVYNQNLDRAIQSFSVPLGPGVTISNVGFHAPPQHPAFANDGTAGSAGYSSTPWTPTQTSDSLTWNSETLAQNPNANAIRWGTLYNFRFDSDQPPQTTNATVGFFKTGTPIPVPIQGPSGAGPTPTPTPTPSPTPTLPQGFTASQVAGSLTQPTVMAFAPDGRLFICEQGGSLRVVKNGNMLPTPFLTLTNIDSSGERGLLGVAFDPDFNTNNFVYVFYTATTPTRHNRISRFTANGDVAVPDSDVVIFDLADQTDASNGQGGAMNFGADGKLYVAVGIHSYSSDAQLLTSLWGKMLRLNRDGTIPADNPYFDDPSVTGQNKAIWARGLRVPFTFSIQPGTGRIFINDVGDHSWEEVNEGVPAANYGWNIAEGPTTDPAFKSPFFVYANGSGSEQGCAITGGAFYNPPVNHFPAEYTGTYFYTDLCSGWIRRFDPSNPSSSSAFASGLLNPVDLKVAPDGGLYYLERNTGSAYRIGYSPFPTPTPTPTPTPSTFQFSQPTYSVAENVAANGLITVTRAGDVNTAAGVTYTTSDGTATFGQDYAPASGTLNFAGGETSKTFNVPIINDDVAERSETVTLALSAPMGGATLGTAVTAVLTITDNDVATGLQYYPLSNPVRLLDTRPGQPACDTPGVPLTGGGTRTEAARIPCTGIPVNAQVIVGNATVVNTEPGATSGFITLYPSGVTRPTVSNLNYVASQIVPNAFTVGLGGGDGAFNIFASSSTHFIVDVTGYYAPPGTGGLFYHPLPNPVRLLDTRPGQPACDTPGVPLTGGGTRTEPARIPCTGIPANAQVIVGNATVANTEPGATSGFITLYPSGATQPTVSNLNYVAGQIVPNAFTVGLGSGDGAFNIFASSSTHFIADLTGYFASAGFSSVAVASPISSPTAMAFAPDGRLFVCQQTGQLRVIEGGVLLPNPFVSLTVNSSGERGLLGVAFDPNFAANQWVYVYYTSATAPIHNRVTRFTAAGNVAVAGSEQPILELNNLSGATNHNGGAIHFGPDNKLYIAVGENANPANSQSVGNLLGKILRINSDGTIPSDNPTTFPGIAGSPSGANQAIWSVGLRNPYTFDFQPGSGRMFINDVGQSAWEEINDGIAGSNYGWSICEGACVPPNANFRDPIFQYGHGTGAATGCAITGGAFYNPAVVTYPSDYVGKYFYAEFCSGWIRRFDPATSTSQPFASGLSSPVDLKVGPDGNLYYLVRGGGGAVFKIVYS